MSAILELKETPEYCTCCDIRYWVDKYVGEDNYRYLYSTTYFCSKTRKDVTDYSSDRKRTRHPDCPLKIVEDTIIETA